MTAYKVDQRHLNHRGRVFHFVSYEGQPADPRREREAVEPTWFLMGPGRRWSVMPHEPADESEVVDQQLLAWLDQRLDE